MICSLFGHRFASKNIIPELRSVLVDLIENKNCDKFYIGNHGEFDRISLSVLAELSGTHNITYYVVVAYPDLKNDYDEISIYPEGLEFVPRRFAISARNNWMVDNSNYIVCYVCHNGGAQKSMKRGLNKGKTVINIAQ